MKMPKSTLLKNLDLTALNAPKSKRNFSHTRSVNGCDDLYCFRHGKVGIYLPDAIGWATLVLTFCEHHAMKYHGHTRDVYENCSEDE